uniref:Wt3.1c n=1 Tax=Streptomyces sp. WT3 TaxID=1178025 RepID=I1WE06_9ACTN|nr:Wt3.1c [Streptomyces sp. WT3]
MNPLIGRERVLSTLGRHVDAVSQGSGGCVIVEGPFGMGKTRLLKAAALEGVERGLTVVAGQTNGTDRPVPLHVLITLLRHVMPDGADFDDLVRPGRNPFWLMDRVGELVENAAHRHPLVIVLDDAQLIDDASGLALRGLVQSLASSPVLWLLARRPVPARPLAQHALDWVIDHAAVRLSLSPLDDGAVAELATGILGAAPDESVLGWTDRCGGNPWLVENLLKALLQAGQVVIVDGTASAVAERLPETLFPAIGRLLGEMPPAVRRLVVSGSRTGRPFTAEEAAVSLGEPGPEVSSSIDWAVNVGLMRREGTELAFRHAVIEEALQQPAFQSDDEPPAPGSTGGSAQTRLAGPPSPAPNAHQAGARTQDAAAGRPGAAAPVVAPSVTPGAAPPAQEPGCGCDGMAARAVSALGDVFGEVPRKLAGALRLLAVAGKGAEAVRLADAALRPGVEAEAESHLVLELSQGLRDTGLRGMSDEIIRRTLARQDLDEQDRAELHGALSESLHTERPIGLHETVTAPWRTRSAGLAPSVVPQRRAGSGNGAGSTAR